MKKVLAMLLIVFPYLFTAAFADDAFLPDVNTDSVFAAFNTDEDSSLEGWRGYTKNTDGTIDASSWYTFVEIGRASCRERV